MAKIQDMKFTINIEDPSGALTELVNGLEAHGVTATPELRRFCSEWVTRNMLKVGRVIPYDECPPA